MTWKWAKVCTACLKELKQCICHKFCWECGVLTNHTTAQHHEAAADMPKEK